MTITLDAAQAMIERARTPAIRDDQRPGGDQHAFEARRGLLARVSSRRSATGARAPLRSRGRRGDVTDRDTLLRARVNARAPSPTPASAARPLLHRLPPDQEEKCRRDVGEPMKRPSFRDCGSLADWLTLVQFGPATGEKHVADGGRADTCLRARAYPAVTVSAWLLCPTAVALSAGHSSDVVTRFTEQHRPRRP
jgi:hypothetical protein